MAMETELILRSGHLSDVERERIDRQLASLAKRLQKFPDPRIEVAIEAMPRRTDVDLRVSLGPLGGHLISHQSAETSDVAVKSAVDDAKRQLERRLATQRGEPTYGVPSRRLPQELRPSNQKSDDEPTDNDADDEEA